MNTFLLPKRFDIFDNDEPSKRTSLLRVRLTIFLLVALVLSFSGFVRADVTQISGGLDTRALSQDPIWGVGEEGLNLKGAFLNLRQVISDDSGDRYILVAQGDANNNLEELEAYQVYAQVKGPLGRINLRVGRYILPVGLLANLDTERELIQTQETAMLGIKLDTGVQVFGFAGPFDYAVSVSQGTGEIDDPDSNKLAVGRLSLQRQDSLWGLSYMDGQVVTDGDYYIRQGAVDRQRWVFDFEVDYVPWLLRGELMTGKDDRVSITGATLMVDYAINAKLSINTLVAGWQGEDDTLEMAAGLTYRLSNTLILRAADTYQRLNGVSENVVMLQLSWEFLHAL